MSMECWPESLKKFCLIKWFFVLGSVNKDNDLAPLINNSGAGFISVNGEDEALLKNAIALYENKDLRKKTGQAAYELLKREFDVEEIAKKIIEKLN